MLKDRSRLYGATGLFAFSALSLVLFLVFLVATRGQTILVDIGLLFAYIVAEALLFWRLVLRDNF